METLDLLNQILASTQTDNLNTVMARNGAKNWKKKLFILKSIYSMFLDIKCF
jgi:hypothetical protein